MYRPSRAASPSPRRGFTLVELLVAIALMTILTGSVVFIFIHSQKIFALVDARVQVYQYARYAFDQMERDLANVVKTSDMEFFDDNPPPSGRVGRYDPGEEIPIRRTEGPDSFYNRSFTVRQPTPYEAIDDGLFYRRDSIYFKTITAVDNQASAALVEYALVDTDRERPKMVKKLWRVTGLDAANPLRPRKQINGSPGSQAQPLVQDLCLYAVEARFELFVRNRRRFDPGEFFEAAGLIDPPLRQPANVRPFEPHPDDGDADVRVVQTYYDVRHDRSTIQPDLGVVSWAEGGLFRTERFFSFPMLREGDRIALSGSGIQPREHTIDSFRRPDGTPWQPTDPATALRIRFKEPVEWPTGASGTDLRVQWDCSWVPSAVRVALKIKDAKSLEPRSVQRVFKILSQ